MFAPGEVVRMTKVIPGLPEGARLFTKYFAERMEEKGYVQKLPGVFQKGKAKLLAYVDDLLMCEEKKVIYQDVKE